MENVSSTLQEIRPVSLDEVKQAFQKARSIKSSYAPFLISFFQPQTFQCLVTSLVVKETFWGKLAVCRISITNKVKEILLETAFGRKKFLHFVNALDDGNIDITGDQIHNDKYVEIWPLRQLNENNIDILHGVCDNLREKTQILQQRFIKNLAEVLGMTSQELFAYLQSGKKLRLQPC